MTSFSFLSLGMTVMIAMFFDYFYLRWSAYKIKLIRCRYAPDALSGRAEIPDMPSVSKKLAGLGDDYYSELRATGSPGFRHMLLDSIAATLVMRLMYSAVIHVLS
jgi:hypothetical protein